MSLDFSAWNKKTEHFFRLSFAYVILFVFFMIDVVNIDFPVIGEIRPSLTIMAIFYWSIYRPTLIPNWFVFLLGLAMDSLMHMPYGLNALIYLLINWKISDQRRIFAGQPFIVVMIGFTVVLFFATLFRWVLYGMLNGGWPDFYPEVGSFILGIMLFPLISILLHNTHKFLPCSEREPLMPKLADKIK